MFAGFHCHLAVASQSHFFAWPLPQTQTVGFLLLFFFFAAVNQHSRSLRK